MRVEVTFDAEGSYAIAYKGGVVLPGPGPLPAPPVLFLGSLAACAGIFAVDYLKTRGLTFAGLRVFAEAAHADAPRRLSGLKVQVALPSPIEERHMDPLRRAAGLCTLKNTLADPGEVGLELHAPVEAVARP